jgi:anti-sigma factor ChrR (cupin superfamily)
VGAALDLPLDAVRKQIHSGMAHLARDLVEEQMRPLGRATHDVLCAESQVVALYALQALPPGEMFRAGVHITGCSQCRDQLKALHLVANLFAFWPTELLRPSSDLWVRLSRRIAAENRGQIELGARRHRPESAWESVAPGVACKLLATDAAKRRVSMLVRLDPGAEYPPHRHAGVEELHLLHGELWIDARKLVPGDYNRADSGTSDARVLSETGCICVLITSQLDELA